MDRVRRAETTTASPGIAIPKGDVIVCAKNLPVPPKQTDAGWNGTVVSDTLAQSLSSSQKVQ